MNIQGSENYVLIWVGCLTQNMNRGYLGTEYSLPGETVSSTSYLAGLARVWIAHLI